ncbi:MAG: DEAD/DEAH box helicase family protein, partial [Clostridiales bacterium]|nr:DEAD/DEAH box helicase family protein [Clostridiales bacterium]
PLDTSLMVATLRPYQEFGTKYILNQQRVLLGDEMGLGKTMQAIAAMAHLAANNLTHFVVVCPVSVMVNWAREVEKHSKLTTITVHGDKREELFKEFQEKGGVMITTYETIVRLNLEESPKFSMLTVDEAHYVKNPEAQRTKALRKMAALCDYRLFMTGTPLENRVEEMIFLVSMLRDSVSSELNSMKAVSKAPEFRSKVAPVYLRRVREDVLKELPEKFEKEEWVQLTDKEKILYAKALVSKNATTIRKVSYDVENLEDSSKIQRLLEICKEAEDDHRKIVIFSFFLGIIEKVSQALGDKCFGIITGAIPS